MITRNESFTIIFFSALVAGQAAIISGEATLNSGIRNTLVALQLVLALGAFIWGWKKHRDDNKGSAGKNKRIGVQPTEVRNILCD
jgi:hypothetical protein